MSTDMRNIDKMIDQDDVFEIDRILGDDDQFTADDPGYLTGRSDPYGSLHKQMDKFTAPPMDNILGFLQMGFLNGVEDAYVDALIDLGMDQLNADCNHQFGILRDWRIQLQSALEVCGHEGLLKELPRGEWSEKAIMAPLPLRPIIGDLDTQAKSNDKEVSSDYLGEMIEPNPAARALNLISLIVRIQRNIEWCQKEGVFCDYTRLFEHFASTPDNEKYLYSAHMMHEFPDFIQMAYGVVSRTQGRDKNMYDHKQSIFARLVSSMGFKQHTLRRGSNSKGVEKGEPEGENPIG